MLRIGSSVRDTLLFVEKVAVLIALITFSIILALSNFVDMPFLETQRSFALFFVAGTLFLAGFVHMLLEEYYGRMPQQTALDTEADIGYYFNRMLNSVKTELCTTHIYGMTSFARDRILECAVRNDELKRRVRITRIVGIQNEADKTIAKCTLEEKEKLEYVDLELFIIDLSSVQPFPPATETANVIIKDQTEALLIFPSRKEGRTKGIYINDENTVREVIRDYWLRIKTGSEEGKAELINEIKIKV
jgi:hypothetical protein